MDTTMLKKLILCLSAVCLVQAAYLDKRDGEAWHEGMQEREEEGEHQENVDCRNLKDDEKPFGPEGLKKAIICGQRRIENVSKEFDKLAEKVAKGGKTDKEWFTYTTDLANLMLDGHHMYWEFKFGLTSLIDLLFTGLHGFDRVEITRCTYLEDETKKEGFGEKDLLPQIKAAISNDLSCFKDVLHELKIKEVKIMKASKISENNVVDFVAETIKDFLELRDDGNRFYAAVNKTTAAYEKIIPGIHTHFQGHFYRKEELVRELLRALQTKK